MNNLKFHGVLEEIVERYPNIDLIEYLEQKLDIPQYKAEILAARIEKEFCQKDETKGEQDSIKMILEKPNKHEIPVKARAYSVDSLSEKEFERFIKWLLEELGYEVHSEKYPVELGVDLVATKDGEKFLIQARRYPKQCKVTNSIILLSQATMRANGCKKLIIVATSRFTKRAIADAQKFGIELWDSDTLDTKIVEARKNYEIESQSCFPQFKESLMQSLLRLDESKDFLIEHRSEGKYDLYLPGVRFPLLSFQVCLGEVVRCVFRIKNNEPVGEFEGTVLVRNDRSNIRIGPDDARAYSLVTQYLEQFLE